MDQLSISCLKGHVLSQHCPSRQILMHLTNRWGVLVMFCLQDGIHRFSELRKRIEGISEKMLTQTLRNLEHDGFIIRKEYPEVPPRVEYYLSTLGEQSAEKIYDLVNWIEANLSETLRANTLSHNE